VAQNNGPAKIGKRRRSSIDARTTRHASYGMSQKRRKMIECIFVVHRPRLLSDNGPSYIPANLAEWLDKRNMGHVRGAPCHPQTQGKIERWHQTLKNRILLENYYLPGDLEAKIDTFVDHYNHRRYHESLSNLTPADVYFGRAQTILLEREKIKRATIQNRRLQHQLNAA
jgi:RNA-directed DNA polymerase